MKKELWLIVLFLFFSKPAFSQKPSGERDKKFRHEFAIGLRYIHVPVGDWREDRSFAIMPEYDFRYLDKFGLRIRFFGWYFRRNEWLFDKQPYYIDQVIARECIYWDILPFYNFRIYKRHCLNIGAGFTNRKGIEKFVYAIYPYNSITGGYEVNDQGIIGEIGYTYDLGQHFVTGVDFGYRDYDRGDPVITAGLKFGVALYH